MVDSGATTKFINKRFVKENHVVTRKLGRPIPLYNIDRSLNKNGSITEVAVLWMTIGDHSEKMVFTVTDIGPEDVIIGLDWLREHNPDIDWERGLFRLSRCPETCRARRSGPAEQAASTSDTGDRPTARKRVLKPKRSAKGKVRSRVLLEEELVLDPEVEWNEDDLLESWERGVNLPDAPQIYVAAGHTYSQVLAEEEYKKKEVKSVEEMVPNEFHEFLKVFSKEASERLPEHKPYDHAIELVPDAKTFHSKVYPLSHNEQEELDKFHKEQLAKGYIRESKSPISSPFFFIKKKVLRTRVILVPKLVYR